MIVTLRGYRVNRRLFCVYSSSYNNSGVENIFVFRRGSTNTEESSIAWITEICRPFYPVTSIKNVWEDFKL